MEELPLNKVSSAVQANEGSTGYVKAEASEYTRSMLIGAIFLSPRRVLSAFYGV